MSSATVRLPTALYRAAEVRRLDALAIDGHGIPGITLMERAGAAVFATLAASWPEAEELLVCCGGGNNGGDGYVVAALARRRGLRCGVLAVSDPAGLKGDAALAHRRAVEAGVAVEAWDGSLPGSPQVVVDALLGTGLDRAVGGAYGEVIEAINRDRAPVIAVDIPSGLHADAGRVMGCAVRARITVSFIGLKRGMFTGDGPEHAGTVAYHDLGVPAAVFDEVPPGAERLDGTLLGPRLGRRDRNAHKGRHGHVLVVGGDAGMTGAPRMAGLAALRAGAGLVSVAVPPAAVGPGWPPELMVHGVAGRGDLAPLLDKATVIAVGPGLGTGAWGRELLAGCLAAERPLVVDADGLNLLAAGGGRRDDWVLTPHPGEAARLLGSVAAQVQADRFGAAAELYRRYGGAVLLKGCGSLVAAADGPVAVCGAGNPGMAAGGMGDVLTGVVAGLRAQGLTAADAARAGAWVHGCAGDRAARGGERGLLATDLLPAIQQMVNPHG